MIQTLLKEVFDFHPQEAILFLIDIPTKDTLDWKWRRLFAQEWCKELVQSGINAQLLTFPATHANNAPLPTTIDTTQLQASDIVIALTEFSATAPLHVLAKKYQFRAASMPGFTKAMLPALQLPFTRIRQDVDHRYQKLLAAKKVILTFCVDHQDYTLQIDVAGPDPIKDDATCNYTGRVINLPSGEAFVAPLDTKSSTTHGILPLQEGNEVNLYTVKHNTIVDASKNTALIQKIREDPAVGNIAELAFGVLGTYGIQPCGRILLDEKLGPHIALGRNDHFGGGIGPQQFKIKENVWHQDFVFIPKVQPKIKLTNIAFRTS